MFLLKWTCVCLLYTSFLKQIWEHSNFVISFKVSIQNVFTQNKLVITLYSYLFYHILFNSNCIKFLLIEEVNDP